MIGLGPNEKLIGVPGSRALLLTPALVLDLDALTANIETMANFARQAKVGLRPHAKTHKSIQIARRQVAAGALGASVATLGEAEILVEGGIAGVLLTTPVVDDAKIERLAALNRRAEGLMAVADDIGVVDRLARAAAAAGKPLIVVLDFGTESHRTGVPSAEIGVALARRIAQSNALSFGGVHSYAGHIQHINDFDERVRAVESQAKRVATLVAGLREAGLAPPIVSGAGTGSHAIDARGGVYTELQAGSYIFTDVQYDQVKLWIDRAQPFRTALFVRATVISNHAPGYATIDAGLKRFATDGPPPRILRGAPEGATYRWMGDEHGAIDYPRPMAPMALGTAVECQAPHCDPTVNLHDNYHVVRGDTLVDIWPVDARGAF